ncbi:MAG: MmcQ/YjbR family DNA-binding protein [Casimicrobiaceae bacterium]
MNVAQVRRYALSLSAVNEEPHFEYSSFRVRGKLFVTVPPDGEHIHIFVGDDEREVALTLHAAFVEPLVWGAKVRGVRVRLSSAMPSVVKQLVRAAWTRKAPKSALTPSTTLARVR